MSPFRKYRYLVIQVLALLFSLAFSASGWAQPCSPISITSTSTLPSGNTGSSYSSQITATGQGTITFTLNGGSLPPGLSMGTTGLISGTPTTAGIYNFTVRATDNCGPAAPQTTAKGFTLVVSPANFNVSILPSFFNVPIDYTSVQNLTYVFSTIPPVSTTMVSSQGIFRVGSTQISANNVQISTNVNTGRGTVSENLTILPSIMQKALSMGNSIMTYNRSFTNGITTVNTQVEIRITTGTAADFRINRMQLYFQNRQPVITIKRNDTTLKTYAEINYVGSGLLQGYWEVDGSFLSNVIQTIASGTTVTIESPAPPILPTFSSGSHRIRFVVAKPSLNIAFPEIQYYVTAEEPTSAELKKLTPLSLLFPYNNGVISYAPITFLWTTREAGVATYLLEFSLKDDERPLFSAYTKNPSYRIPETIVTTFFSPGKTYAWKVKGFDTFNNVTSESTRFIFTMGE